MMDWVDEFMEFNLLKLAVEDVKKLPNRIVTTGDLVPSAEAFLKVYVNCPYTIYELAKFTAKRFEEIGVRA